MNLDRILELIAEQAAREFLERTPEEGPDPLEQDEEIHAGYAGPRRRATWR